MDMSENKKLLCVLVIACLMFGVAGVAVGVVLESFLWRDSIIIPKQKLIEQNLAEYDSKTGEFKLKIEVK